MEAALFDDEHGYYSKNIRTVGRRGDFSTSPSLDPALAKAIAGWLRQRWREKPQPPKNLIEVGAGDGSLAEQTARALGWAGRHGLRYHIVETSPPLRAQQQERLGGGRRFRWHGSMPEALAACAGRASIISNELVDAFPATLLQWASTPPRWRQVSLDHDGERWTDEPGQPVSSPPGSSLAGAVEFADGQRIERHDSYFEWLRAWLPGWRSGEMLTIDYGDTFPALYHRRPRGTLRAYFAHQRLETLPEILARPGRQDITADIDFTDLQQRGELLGLENIDLCTQAEFIARHHPVDNPSHNPLTDPHGAGGAFKILQQNRLLTADH